MNISIYWNKKKKIWTFLCGNGIMKNGGGNFFSQKSELSFLGSTREWDSSYNFFLIKEFFWGVNSLCSVWV